MPKPNEIKGAGDSEKLTRERLALPEHYLYRLQLREGQDEPLEDTAERRRKFKKLLVERRVAEGMELPQVDQREIADFMAPEDMDMQLDRSSELLRLTEQHLEECGNLAEAERKAMLELFHREAPLRRAEMDRAYFENAELVRADLEEMAAATQKRGKKINPKDLTMGYTCMRRNFFASNGEKIIGREYISRASKVFKLEGKLLLRRLKEIAGLELKEYSPMDAAYFANPTKVRADLEAMTRASTKKRGKAVKTEDLNTNHRGNHFIASNGEELSIDKYINRAILTLGIAETVAKAKPKHIEIFKYLKKLAGLDIKEYPPMDAAYFANPTKVRADLEEIAKAVSKDLAKPIKVQHLNTSSRYRGKDFIASNGENISFLRYLDRSAIALGRAKNSNDAQGKRKDSLEELRCIAGFQIEKYLPMNAEYFADPTKVRADLEALAAAINKRTGKVISIQTMTTSYVMGTPFRASNGRDISGMTYFTFAGNVLGISKNRREAQIKIKLIIKSLKKITEL